MHRIDEPIETNLPTQKIQACKKTIAVAPSVKISTNKGIEKNAVIRLGDAVGKYLFSSFFATMFVQIPNNKKLMDYKRSALFVQIF